MFPAWGQLAPLQASRRIYEQDLVPFAYYGPTYGSFPPPGFELPKFDSVPNSVEEATRAEIEAVKECEEAKKKFEEAKKIFEECETKMKDAQQKLQWAKFRAIAG